MSSVQEKPQAGDIAPALEAEAQLAKRASAAPFLDLSDQ